MINYPDILNYRLVLGSASPRRKEILASMGYTFEVIPSNIDEKAIRFDNPRELVLALANAKADALLPNIGNDALLVTSDLVIYFDGKILEKPESPEAARRMLSEYGTKPVQTFAGVVVTNTKTGKRAQGIDVATITFKSFSEELLKEFADSGKAMAHAGGFASEHPLFMAATDHIEGTLESIGGLPIELTQKLIQEALKTEN